MPSTDAVVIGAGPVGLFQVFQLGLHGLRAHVIDALPHLGGQCAELYGDKPIYDIPAVQACTGNELVQRLLAQIEPFAPVFHLSQQVDTVQALPGGRFLVGTTQGTQLQARRRRVPPHAYPLDAPYRCGHPSGKTTACRQKPPALAPSACAA